MNRRISALLAHRIAITVGVLLAIVVGASFVGIAVLRRGSHSATRQADPCFGFGQLLSTRVIPMTPPLTPALNSSAGKQGAVNVCHASQFDTVTLDAATGKVITVATDYTAMISYYNQHPEDLPANKALQAFEQSAQQQFIAVPKGFPTSVAGCDPSWVTSLFKQAGVAFCHPSAWTVLEDNQLESMMGTPTVEVGVLGLKTTSYNTLCVSPASVETASGIARVCAVGTTSMTRARYGVTLPTGRKVGINVYSGASSSDEEVALRVAMNVQALQ